MKAQQRKEIKSQPSQPQYSQGNALCYMKANLNQSPHAVAPELAVHLQAQKHLRACQRAPYANRSLPLHEERRTKVTTVYLPGV